MTTARGLITISWYIPYIRRQTLFFCNANKKCTKNGYKI
jgi:hypothetical protein